MSFGLGLGGFVQGLRGGIEAGQAMDDRRERREERAERRQERERERANTESVAAIGRSANEEIAAGANREDVEAKYWQQVQDEYARQGRPDLARQFQQWREGDEQKRGIRHFQNGMVLFEMARRQDGTFDPQLMRRGLDQLQRAQKLNSYGGDREFQFRPIVEGEGESERTIGFRIQFRGDDGQNIERDIQPGDIPRAAAMMFNPQAAFEDRRRQDEQRAKQRETSRTEQRSEWQTAEEQVRKEYEERRQDPTRRETTPMRPWSELADDERDTMIRNRSMSRVPPAQRPAAAPGLAGAGSAMPEAPVGRVAFDRVTGQPAGPTAPARAPAAPAPITPAVPAPTPGPGATTPGAPVAGVAEAMRPGPVSIEAERMANIRAGAERALQAGETPDNVARGLERAGVPLEAWPESIRSAVERRQQVIPSATRALGLAGVGR